MRLPSPGGDLEGASASAPSSTPAEATPVATAQPRVGTTIADRYFVHHVIGRGAMGDVYKATDVRLDRYVALKILKNPLAQDPAVAERFQREVRAATRLNHPNSVTILDYGVTQDGAPFMAMELLGGFTLGHVIEREGRLPEARGMRIAAQVLAALAEAEALRVVHRDLKPANVMLERRPDELVKVLDFGIAQLSEQGVGRITRDGKVWGTPGYMSPEQLRGEELDGRSDLYSVGVMLHEMLTGKLPFEADTDLEMAGKHLHESPPSLCARMPGASFNPALEELVLRALSKDRRERPRSAGEMRAQLLAICPAPGTEPTSICDGTAIAPTTELDQRPDDPLAAQGAPEPTGGAGAASTRSHADRRVARISAFAAASVLALAAAWVLQGSTARDLNGASSPSRAGSRTDRAGSEPAPQPAAPPVPAEPSGVRPASVVRRASASARDLPGSLRGGSTSPISLERLASAPSDATEMSLTSVVAHPLVQSQGSRPSSAHSVPRTPVRTVRPAAAAKEIKIVRSELNSVPTPAAASGDGVLSLDASPWAEVSVDGRPLGETPREVLLTAGAHEVTAVHPAFGVRRAVVKISAGERRFWSASFER